MVSQLIMHERIETTLPKAKELRRVADQMVTLGKEVSIDFCCATLPGPNSDPSPVAVHGACTKHWSEICFHVCLRVLCAVYMHGQLAVLAIACRGRYMRGVKQQRWCGERRSCTSCSLSWRSDMQTETAATRGCCGLGSGRTPRRWHT
jgi:hypothetical protein